MKRRALLTILAALVFLGIVLARMPAGWIVPARLGPGSCASLEGTLWSGSCSGLRLKSRALGDLSWEMHPLRLLAARLAAHCTLTGSAVTASGDIEIGFGGRLSARHLVADLPLDPALLPDVPPTLSGHAHADLVLLRLDGGRITQLQGRIEAHDLTDHGEHVTPLGSYAVTFPGGSGDPVGTLHDLEGPLALTGTLRLTGNGAFELQGLIAPRAGAAPELIDNLRFLGSPDASGRRPFSLSGTL